MIKITLRENLSAEPCSPSTCARKCLLKMSHGCNPGVLRKSLQVERSRPMVTVFTGRKMCFSVVQDKKMTSCDSCIWILKTRKGFECCHHNEVIKKIEGSNTHCVYMTWYPISMSNFMCQLNIDYFD
ncbi:hypothetical protein ACRRTK_018293 [Alexandromys fortis]